MQTYELIYGGVKPFREFKLRDLAFILQFKNAHIGYRDHAKLVIFNILGNYQQSVHKLYNRTWPQPRG